MNKYISLISMCSMFFTGSLCFAQVSTASMQRQIATQMHAKQAEVQITLDWTQEVEMREVMLRPVRGFVHPSKIVLTTRQKTTHCRGMLIETGQVVTPAVCVRNGNWDLSKITLAFSNGKQGIGAAGSVSVKEDVAYIKVCPKLTQGLVGVPVALTPKGKSLKEHFGDKVMNTLSSFFHSKGVVQSQHYFRPGKVHYSNSTLQVGDGILYEGKLVALVKKNIKHYRSLSEKPLAILR